MASKRRSLRRSKTSKKSKVRSRRFRHKRSVRRHKKGGDGPVAAYSSFSSTPLELALGAS